MMLSAPLVSPLILNSASDASVATCFIVDQLAQRFCRFLRTDFAEPHDCARVGQRLNQHRLGFGEVVALQRLQNMNVRPIVPRIKRVAEKIAFEEAVEVRAH